jgi:hypothetical protein
VGILGQPAGLAGEHAKPGRGPARGPDPAECARRCLPARDGLVDRPRALAPDLPLHPVGHRLVGGPEARAQEVEEILDPALRRGAAAQRDDSAPHGGARQRQRGLHGHGYAQTGQHLVIERSARIGPAEDDDDVVRSYAFREQLGDLTGHGLRLGSLARALEEGKAAVGLDGAICEREQPPVELPQRGAGRVGRVERKTVGDHRAQLVAKLGEELRSRSESIVVLVVDRDGDRARRAEGAQHVELLLGQVVESVNQDRARAPGPAAIAHASRHRGRSRVGVVAAGGAPALDVAGIEDRELGLVFAALDLTRRPRELIGPQERRLELPQQALEGRREARLARRGGEQAEVGVPHGRANECKSLRVRQEGSHGRARRRRDLVAQPMERADRSAEQRPVPAAELALEPGGVIGRGHDQHGLPIENGLQPLPDRARAPRVRRSDDD